MLQTWTVKQAPWRINLPDVTISQSVVNVPAPLFAGRTGLESTNRNLYHRVARTLNSWSLLATVNQKPSNSYKANQYILLLKSSSSAHVQSDAVHLINFLHAACSTLLYTSVVFVRGILHANILIKNMVATSSLAFSHVDPAAAVACRANVPVCCG